MPNYPNKRRLAIRAGKGTNIEHNSFMLYVGCFAARYPRGGARGARLQRSFLSSAQASVVISTKSRACFFATSTGSSNCRARIVGVAKTQS